MSTKGIVFISNFFLKKSRSSPLLRLANSRATLSLSVGNTVMNIVARFKSGEHVAEVTVMSEVPLFSRPRNSAAFYFIRFAAFLFLCVICVLLKTIL